MNTWACFSIIPRYKVYYKFISDFVDAEKSLNVVFLFICLVSSNSLKTRKLVSGVFLTFPWNKALVCRHFTVTLCACDQMARKKCATDMNRIT